jgi:hypothetical protein
MKVYQILARAIGARNRCEVTGNTEWFGRWSARISELLESFPSGSGFDSGTKLDDSSTPEKLVFTTAFHHMNDGGMYDGWTEHSVIVTPSLEMGYSMRVTGRDRNDIKQYIFECFGFELDKECPEFNNPCPEVGKVESV